MGGILISTNLVVPAAANLAKQKPTALELAGRIANKHAESAVFDDYHSRRSDNTIRTHAAALSMFAAFLDAAGVDGVTGEALQGNPES